MIQLLIGLVVGGFLGFWLSALLSIRALADERARKDLE